MYDDDLYMDCCNPLCLKLCFETHIGHKYSEHVKKASSWNRWRLTPYGKYHSYKKKHKDFFQKYMEGLTLFRTLLDPLHI